MLRILTIALYVLAAVSSYGQQWKCLGPFGSDTYGNRVAWQGGTGQIHCIVFDPDSQNIVYAGSPFGGLWKSVDSGKNWSATDIDVDQQLELASVSDIAITKKGVVKTIWVATGHPSGHGDVIRVFEPFSSGLYTSVNGGRNFKPVMSFNKKHGFQFTNKKHVTRIVAHPNHPDILFAATSDGLYQTTNAGASWKLVLTGQDLNESGTEAKPVGAAIFSAEFSKTDPEHVVYAAGPDIYRSVKGGKKGTFKSITHEKADLFGDSKDCIKGLTMNIELNVAGKKDVAYVAAFITGDTCGAWKGKRDYCLFYFNGDDWEKKQAPLNQIPDGIRLKMATVQGKPNIIYAGSAVVDVSSDFGKTWKQALDYNQPGHADIHAIRNIPGTDDILAGTDGGIFKYTYATKKVEEYNNGLCLAQITAMGASLTNPDRIIIGLQDAGANLWNGHEWTKLPTGGDGLYPQMIDGWNDSVFFSCHNGQFYKGNSDKNINLRTYNTCTVGCPLSFAQDTRHPDIFYYGDRDVYKSADGAKTWCRVSDFSKKGFYINPVGHILYDIELAPSDPDIIFAAFNGSPGCCNSALFKSVTGGNDCNGNCGGPLGADTWTLINIPKVELADNHQSFLVNGNHSISSIAISDKDANKFWLGFSYSDLDDPTFRVYKTDDNGANWQKDDAGLPDYPVTKLLYVSGSNDDLIAGTWNGVFYKKGTNHWQKLGNGLPHIYISGLAINYPTHKLRVSTFGRGVWEIDLP